MDRAHAEARAERLVRVVHREHTAGLFRVPSFLQAEGLRDPGRPRGVRHNSLGADSLILIVILSF